MGISANQARFLSLTTRQVDLEHRVQQICQRRLRLSSELERIATDYNNQIGNRKMFVFQPIGQDNLSLSTLAAAGYKVFNKNTNQIVGPNPGGLINSINQLSVPPVGYIGITTAAEFQSALNTNPNGNYILMGDIDMSSLGTLSHSLVQGIFQGTLDGNGYSIKNLNINSNSTLLSSGLFEHLDNATIKNIVLDNITLNSLGSHSGALAGDTNNSVIDNCAAINVNVHGVDQVGGLIGVAGMNTSSTDTITSCYVSGNISGGNMVGGLVGWGISDIISSYASGTVSGNTMIGGLVGHSMDNISNSFATNNVSGTTVGGLVGSAVNANISSSYATGDINGGSCAGGFVGMSQDTIINSSYAIGDVSGSTEVGGFAGYVTDSTITSNYSSGNVTGLLNVGGLVGGLDTGIIDNSNFYNMETSGQAQGCGMVNTIAGAVSNIAGLNAVAFNAMPQVQNNDIETNIRNGNYTLLRDADIYTQSPLNLGNKNYEMVDWRTVPAINDELFRADDMDAENKYDRVVSQINSQDKKLQLEQSSVEVEYKAIVSEKEAVKKILDTNTGNSFKYFS